MIAKARTHQLSLFDGNNVLHAGISMLLTACIGLQINAEKSFLIKLTAISSGCVGIGAACSLSCCRIVGGAGGGLDACRALRTV